MFSVMGRVYGFHLYISMKLKSNLQRKIDATAAYSQLGGEISFVRLRCSEFLIHSIVNQTLLGVMSLLMMPLSEKLGLHFATRARCCCAAPSTTNL